MTNLGKTYLSLALFALIFIFHMPLLANNNPRLMEHGLWDADAQRGYKVMSIDEAIYYCQENERRHPAKNWKYFREPNAPYLTLIKNVLPKLYNQYKNNPSLTLGLLSLNEMFSRFEKVQFCENYHPQYPMQADAERFTDLYIPERNFVILNHTFSTTPYETRMEILLHVFLGASGYEDNHYQLTNALMMAEKSLAPYVLSLFPTIIDELYWKPVEKPMPKKYMNIKSGVSYPIYIAGPRGGFTGGGGGGGDSISSMIKRALYELAPDIPGYTKKYKMPCQQAWSNPINYLFDVKATPIESKLMLEKVSINPKGGYFINIQTYTYTGGKDVTTKENLDIVFSIVNDLCKTKYGKK